MMLMDIDPNLVKPGWTPLLITIVLAAVMVLLFLSMRRQFGKINVPTEQEVRDRRAANPPADQDSPTS
ncbi:MAG TPA: hypothetical protein VF642_04170 [Propionibacteriaceae bacterium]|jgi:hypothetical protein